jgi:hypothetical protein
MVRLGQENIYWGVRKYPILWTTLWIGCEDHRIDRDDRSFLTGSERPGGAYNATS